MVTVAKLNADLTANTSSFETGMNRARGASRGAKSQISGDMQVIGKAFKANASEVLGFSSALAGLASGTSLVFLAKGALEAADSIAILAEKLGLTTDQIQKYQYIAKLSGASTEQLQTGFAFLNRQIAEGKLPYQNLNQAIGDIAARMEAARDGTARARLAFEAMGKSGVNLIPFFLNGRRGLQELGDEAVRVGFVLSGKTIQSAKEFKDQIEILGGVITRSFQAGLLEGFIGDSKAIRDIYTDPKFVQSVRDLGSAFGEVAHFALMLAQVPAYLRAIFIELPSLGGQEIGKQIAIARGLRSPNPNVSTVRPATVDRATFIKPPAVNNAPGGTGSLLQQPESQLKKYISSLNLETAALGLSQRALAQQKAVIEGNSAARTDFEKHLRKTPELTNAEAESIQNLAGKYFDLQKQQQAAERLNEEFKSSFVDAAASVIEGSQSMGDALRSLIKNFADLILKQQILQPLADSIFGTKGSGGGIGTALAGGGFSSLFNNSGQSGLPWQSFGSSNPAGGMYLGSFATGLNYAPHDGIAKIHRGEAVMPASDAAAWRKGDSGSTYYIDATGASDSKITELKALIMTLAGPGRVEDRVRDARRRGQNI